MFNSLSELPSTEKTRQQPIDNTTKTRIPIPRYLSKSVTTDDFGRRFGGSVGIVPTTGGSGVGVKYSSSFGTSADGFSAFG